MILFLHNYMIKTVLYYYFLITFNMNNLIITNNYIEINVFNHTFQLV